MIVAYKFLDIKLEKGKIYITSPLYNNAGVWHDLKATATCDPQWSHNERRFHPNEESPAANCICGIHALKTTHEATEQNIYGGFLTRLILWGKIIEGEKGYRAQYARVDSIIPYPCKIERRHEKQSNGIYYLHGRKTMITTGIGRIISDILCQECYDEGYHYQYGYTQLPIPLSHIGLTLGIPVDYEYWEKYATEEKMMVYKEHQAKVAALQQQAAATFNPPPVVTPSPVATPPNQRSSLSNVSYNSYWIREYIKILKTPITMKDGEKWRVWKKTRLGDKNARFLIRIRKEIFNKGINFEESRVAAVFALDKIQYHSSDFKPFQNNTHDDSRWEDLAEAVIQCRDIWSAEDKYSGVYKKLVGNK